MCRVGQNRIYTPYLTVHLVISLSKKYRIYTVYIYIYILFWPTLFMCLIATRSKTRWMLIEGDNYPQPLTTNLYMLNWNTQQDKVDADLRETVTHNH